MFQEIHSYHQKLLNAQYDVAEIIQHLLTRGEVREDFLKDVIKKRKENLKIEKGILCDHAGLQSPQCDILIAKNGVAVERLGSHCIMQAADCNIVLEVKSNATTSDLRDCNDKAARIKGLDATPKPLYGLFCYKYETTKKNLLKSFGYKYDSETKAFSNIDQAVNFDYPNIDFLLAISVEQEEIDSGPVLKQMFLIKDNDANKYQLCLDYPAIRYFWRLIDGL